jgi:hypothetical protein
VNARCCSSEPLRAARHKSQSVPHKKENTMPATKKPANRKTGENEVADFMQKLDHPLKPEIEAVRSIILGVSPEISEGIKWNSPSFRVNEYFATVNIRKDALLVILHLGAKVKGSSFAGLAINDPAGLLEWLGKDRAAVRFQDMNAIESSRTDFENIVRQWITYL